MRQTIKKAFLACVPVIAGYIFLGVAFGLVMQSRGFSVLWVLAMSIFIYAGSMQFVAVDLLGGGAVSLVTLVVTTIMVNARHSFYGISMIDRYKNAGIKKPYLIFALSDETYSLVCHGYDGEPEHESDYYFFVTLFDQCFWVLGSIMGFLFGNILPFEIVGIDFALTALFVTVFCDQWISTKSHFSAVAGVVISAACLLVFGAENFLIPSMILILLVLSVYKLIVKNHPENKTAPLEEQSDD